MNSDIFKKKELPLLWQFVPDKKSLAPSAEEMLRYGIKAYEVKYGKHDIYTVFVNSETLKIENKILTIKIDNATIEIHNDRRVPKTYFVICHNPDQWKK